VHQFDLTFDLLKIILITLFSLVVALLIFLNLKRTKRNAIIINILLVTLLLAISDLYIQKFITTDFPRFNQVITFLFAPVFFLFIKNFTIQDSKIQRSYVWYIVPTILIIFISQLGNYTFSLLLASLTCIHLGIYLILSFRELIKNKSIVNSNKKKTKWLWHIVIITFLIYLSVSVEVFFYKPILVIRYSILLIFLCSLYLLFRFVILKSVEIYFFYKYEKAKITDALSKKYKDSPLTTQSSSRIAEELTGLIETKKLYLNDTLSLKELSEELGTSPRYLSQSINENFNCNFFDFTNNYRIEEAKKMFANKSYSDYKIYEIMYAVGFNSRSSFINAFKKNTGLTPKEYKNKLSKR